MKSKIRIFITMFVTAWLCFCTSDSVYAENFSNARLILVNEAVQDSVDRGYSYAQNLYEMSILQDGSVTIHFSNPLQKDSRSFWKVTLYNDSYSELCTCSIKGNQTDTDVVAMGIPAGKYYIKVTSTDSSDARSTDTYTLTAQFAASDVWEKELNEDFTSASVMELNTDYYGTTRRGYSYEKDYYKVSIGKQGYLNVSLSNNLQKDAKSYWILHLYNDSYQELCSSSVYGNQGKTNLVTTGLDAGTYYIRVNSTDSSDARSQDIYTLRADFTAADTWEKELNDDFTMATSMNLEQAYYGTTRQGYSYEKDYYRFDIPSEGYFRIETVTPVLKDSNTYWRVYLYDASYKELTNMKIQGNHEKHNIDRTLSAGTYYISVTSADSSDARSLETYQLKVMLREQETEKEPENEIHTHTPGSWVTVTEATVSMTGKQVRKCTVCGEVTEERDIPKLKPETGTDAPTGPGQAGNDSKPSDKSDLVDQGKEDNTTPDNPNMDTTGGNSQPGADRENGTGGEDIITDNPDDPDLFDPDDLFDEIDSDEITDPDDQEDFSEDVFYDVEWNVSSAVLQLGKSTSKVKAEASEDDDIDKYLSSDTSVVTVNDDGIITAKGVGKAVVRAVTEHGCTADVVIKVQKKAVVTKKITVKSKNVQLKDGKTYQLGAQVTPITSSQKIVYKSSNSKIVAVNSKGKIKAKKAGTVTIKVRSGKKVVKIRVTVN